MYIFFNFPNLQSDLVRSGKTIRPNNFAISYEVQFVKKDKLIIREKFETITGQIGIFNGL